jgi:predicted O-linked N-acetylglucosamine transferase (SPINDLY family)
MGGMLTDARAAAQCALAIDPNFLPARCNLADIAATGGDAEAADRIYQAEMQCSTLSLPATSSHLLISNRLAGLSAEALAERHRHCAARYEPVPNIEWVRGCERDRRLRVGYISGDLRRHSVAYFIEPVLAHHDRQSFEICVYSTNADADDYTLRLQSYCDRWTDCAGIADEIFAERIQKDEIDILVDLSGHTAWNALRVFARKPAPVQVTWLGYPTTTGLSAMDYRISDWQVDPPGHDVYSVERVVRLPTSYYCYRPLSDAPPVAQPPLLASGRPTFGSFNDIAKLTRATLDLWAATLNATPGSRLLVKASALADASVRADIERAFAERHVDAARLTLHGWKADLAQHLAVYNEIDLALDTYPYNGGTTTCEALWMGVPVITLCGTTHASRMGASLLNAAGLADCVCETPERFVRLASEMAGQPDRLAALRSGMRRQLSDSALFDEAAFTRGLQNSYREMWSRWCDAQPRRSGR